MASRPTSNLLDTEIIRLEKVLAQARESNDQAEILEVLVDLGKAHLDAGDTPKALTQFEEALTLAQEIENPEQEARILGLRGLSFKHIGNYHFALQSFRKSHQLAEKIDQRVLVCDSLTQIGFLQSDLDDNLKAISSLERALGESMQLGDPLRHMRIAGALGNCFYKVESYDKSLEYLKLALETSRKLGDTGAKSAYLIAMGNSLVKAEAPEEANQSFEEALQLAAEIGNRRAEIRALNGLMNANAEMGKTRLAVMYGEQAVHLAGDIQDWGTELSLLYQLSNIHFGQNQYEQALNTLEQALIIASEMESWDWQIQVLNQIGEIYFNLDALPQSLDAFEQSFEVAKKCQSRSQQVNILGQISSIKAQTGDFNGALKAAQQSLYFAQQEEDNLLLGEANIMLAFAYRDLNKFDHAIKYCQSAIDTFEELGADVMLDQAKQFLAELEALN
jgi:tetratricopeptide (TPR) repeat protein